MTTPVLAVVLFAALLHASWNALLKTGTDGLLDALLVALAASAVAALVLPFLPPPARASWPYVAASAGIHTLYFALLALAYRDGHFGPSYTLMRGTAPLLVTAVGAAGAVERVSAATGTGVLLVSAGVLSMAVLGRRGGGMPPRALAFTMANAIVIAAYTLVDGRGVRLSGSPASYTAWVFLLDALPLAAGVLLVRGTAALRHARAHGARALIGGALTVAAYSLALWAMTRAPIAAVAAARETSVVFAALIAAWQLREPLGAPRIAAAAVVAVGVMLLGA